MPVDLTPGPSPQLRRGVPEGRSEVKILFLGDIVGKPGRQGVRALLPALRQELKADIVLANVENLAHGKGMTTSTLSEVMAAGVDIGTGGNHTFSKPEANELLANPKYNLVRPENFGSSYPGQGIKTFTVGQKTVMVINLLGQHGMPFEPVESPFKVMERWLGETHEISDAIIVDLHAEATSEKVAMGWYLDGKVSLVVGTHTHVPTADARILPQGTAFVTDLGMTGLRDSSLGVDKNMALERFLNGQAVAFDIPEHGLVALNGVLVKINHGKATSIERIYREVEV